MSSEEQKAALNLLHLQLTQSQEHVSQLSSQLTQTQDKLSHLTMEHNTLREQSSNAIIEVTGMVAQTVAKKHQMNLCKLKGFEPGIFHGNDKDDVFGRYKRWAKSIKGHCEAQETGFRKALCWAENETDLIDEDALTFLEWGPAAQANVHLYNMLWMGVTDDALSIVERTPERGFEAWRALRVRYNPKDGKFELDRITAMLNRQPCKTLEELPAAADKLERDLKHYEDASANKFPENLKMSLLQKILPPKSAAELQERYTMGQTNFQEALKKLVNFANQQRVTKQRSQCTDMEVDLVVKAQSGGDEGDGCPGGDEEDSWWWWNGYEDEYGDENVDYMGKDKGKGGKNKGKGKGKSKGEGKGKGTLASAPWSYPPFKGSWYYPYKGGKGGDGKSNWWQGGKTEETRTCHGCGKPGHLKRDCPETPKNGQAPRPVLSVEGAEDWL